MKRTKIILIVVLLLLMALLIGIGFSMLSQWEAQNKAPFSAENASPEGIKALYKLYQVRGYQTKLWKQDYEDLPNTTQDLLIIANPEVKVPEQQKRQAIKKWVSKGNTVVLWAQAESAWTKAFQFQGVACMYSLQKQVTSMVEDTWLQRVKRLNWTSGLCVYPQTDQENILVDRNGSALMVKKTVGKGAIYYIPEVTMMMNSQINQLDHLYLLIAVAEWTQGVIWFDESVHPWPPPIKTEANSNPNQPNELNKEAAEPPSIFDLLNVDGWLILLQILLLLLLFLYAKGKRFAVARVKWKQEQRNAMEFIEAMANWYHRSHLRKEVLGEYQQALRTELQQTFRLSTNHTSDEMKFLIQQYLGRSYLQRYERLTDLPEQRTKKIPFAIFQRAIVEIQQLRKELHQWKTKMSNGNKR